MVTEARTRADDAEARLTNALERAEEARRDAEEHARTLLSNARHNADDIVSQAREHAETILSEAVTDAERERALASSEVDELSQQRESITSYLDDLRALLSSDPVNNLAAASRFVDEHAAEEATETLEDGSGHVN